MKFKFIKSKKGVCGGKPCFSRTRIPVYIILEMMAAGNSMEEILKEYPNLSKAHIFEALRFAAEVVNYEESANP